MRTAIIDDSIAIDWVGAQMLPISTLSEIVTRIKDDGFSVAVATKSLMIPAAQRHDIVFSPIDASDLQSFNHENFDTLLVDYSLKGHDDCEGVALVNDLISKG